jgi:hypothetical protein
VKTKLSDSMLLALHEIEKYGDPSYSARGMAERGGRATSVYALVERGYIRSRMRDATPEEKAECCHLVRVQEWEVTDAGREVWKEQVR